MKKSQQAPKEKVVTPGDQVTQAKQIFNAKVNFMHHHIFLFFFFFNLHIIFIDWQFLPFLMFPFLG